MNVSLGEVLSRVRNGGHHEFLNDTFKSIISFGIASALSYLHSRGIVHCNISPNNILLDANFRPRLCGFSFSRNMNDRGAEILSGGTPRYKAPELWTAEEYDEKVDVFSYGMVLYELVTGRLPFERVSNLGLRRGGLAGQRSQNQ
jgi:serine/threonine protein kinase